MNNIGPFDEHQILARIEGLEAKRRRRSIVLTILPLGAALVLVLIAGQVIKRLHEEQRQTVAARAALESQTLTLNHAMADVGRQLAAAVEAVSAIEALIESKQSYLRTIDEARFLIDLRMRFDSVHAALDAVAATAPELATVRPWRQWVTVIKSTGDLSEVGAGGKLPPCLEGVARLATFRTPNGMFALALIGDGSFTAAYRETVRLKDTGCVPGAYFAETEKWKRVSGP